MSNKTYMCILRSQSGGCDKPSASDMEAMMMKYQAWQQEFTDNILDMGSPLTSEGAVVKHDAVIDGPFIEMKEMVGGYMLLTTKTLDEAVKVIEASPMIANPNVSIEIREIGQF